MLNRFNTILISITSTMLLMLAFMVINNSQADTSVPEDSFSAYSETKLPELAYYDKYNDLKADGKTAVVYPIFTQSAYDWDGIHDYYTGHCDTCTTTKLATSYEKTFAASGNGFRILEFLGYQAIDDMDIKKNPSILNNYDRVIVLHNEFVTKTEFNAITHHQNVIYMYPGSLRSEITVNYGDNTITLTRGPGFPTSDTKTAFNWEPNQQYFSDWECSSWKFYETENGHALNCYPETFLPSYGYEMLKTLKNL